MNQTLQIAEMIDQEIRRRILEGLRYITVRNATCPDGCIAAGQNVDRRIPDNPCPLPVTFCVGENLIDPDGIVLFAIKTITAVHGGEMAVDAQTVEHRTAKVNRFVR